MITSPCITMIDAGRYVVCFDFLGNPSGWTVNVGAMICTCALSDYLLDINYKQKETYLFNYLDEFDRDICALNLKANAAILLYLEKKCLNRVQGQDNAQYSVIPDHVAFGYIAFVPIETSPRNIFIGTRCRW
jgi:hypothetical protein